MLSLLLRVHAKQYLTNTFSKLMRHYPSVFVRSNEERFQNSKAQGVYIRATTSQTVSVTTNSIEFQSFRRFIDKGILNIQIMVNLMVKFTHQDDKNQRILKELYKNRKG